ncbi:MAG: hypothetical protein KF726_12540 [Anaerolineae bacterium]|nr:hypothetical protein [Anaerolineae bacterium]
MKRLFSTLRQFVDRKVELPDYDPDYESIQLREIEAFERRIDVLTRYAEQSMAYEEALTSNYERLEADLQKIKDLVEANIDAGKDRDALEFLRLAVRLRPQRDLVAYELNSFHAVADALIMRVNTLVAHLDEAREYARNARLSQAATQQLDATMTKLTRYFVLLERVAAARRQTLEQRLVAKLGEIIDDRKLDLEMASYVLARRRALKAENS